MVSIIVPTFNEQELIAATLRQLLLLKGDFEIIVTDGGSSDNTLSIVEKFPAITIVRTKKGRAMQMNEGAKCAKGNILLFLHADTLLPQNALFEIEDIMKDEAVGSGSFYLRFDRQEFFFRIYSWFSQINHSLFTYGDQAIFVRKALFERMNGFKLIPLMEDVEIQSRLRRQGKFVKLKHPVTTSARRFTKNGILRQQVVNIVLVVLYKMGVSAERLKNLYR